jgi:hypothetical protein
MKKMFLLLLIFSSLSYSQKITLNVDSKLYEFQEIKESSNLNLEFIEKKLISLGYSDIVTTDSSVIGKNFFSVIIMGTPLQVFYNVEFEFKDNRHRLTIRKFIIDDKRWSPVPLENIKSGKKKWISKINEELPKIINSFNDKSDW